MYWKRFTSFWVGCPGASEPRIEVKPFGIYCVEK